MVTKTSKTNNIKNWIKILQSSNINGCITGSCMLDADFDCWDETPDVDLFVYSDREMIWVLAELTKTYGLKFGVDDSVRSELQEKQKFKWLLEDKKNKSKFTGGTLATIKLHDPSNGTIINVSHKANCKTVADVINSFDMTIIMKGYDIRGEFTYDMTTQWSDAKTAIPNKLRKTDTDLLGTAYWVRQFDRVIKYYNRGYDTRPMAQFYLDEIDAVLERGNIWTSEGSEQFFNQFAEEFKETRDRISKWLKSKED